MKLRRIDLNHEEFLAAVSGEMTPAELGVYWMICLLQYNRGGQSIRYDMEWLRRKFRARPGNRVIKGIVDGLIKSGRLIREGDELYSSRARAETERRLSLLRAMHENGKRGGRPRNDINGIEKAKGLHDQKDTTTTTTIDKKEEDSPHVSSPPCEPLDQWGPSPAHEQQAILAGWDHARLFHEADNYRDQQANAVAPHRDREAGFRKWIRKNGYQVKPNGHARPNGCLKSSPMNNWAKGMFYAITELEEKDRRTDIELDVPLLDCTR